MEKPLLFCLGVVSPLRDEPQLRTLRFSHHIGCELNLATLLVRGWGYGDWGGGASTERFLLVWELCAAVMFMGNVAFRA